MGWGEIDWRAGWLDWHRKRFWVWVPFVLYTLAGFVIAPWLLRGAIVDAVQQQVGLTAQLDDVDVNPLVLSARLENFRVNDPGGTPLLQFDELYLNFELSSILHRAWTFGDIRLVNPLVHAVRNESGGLNLLALVPPATPSESPDDTASVVRLIVQRFELAGGRADVIDLAARDPFETHLGPMDVTVVDFSTLPDDSAQQTVSIETESGGSVQWTGTLVFAPLRSQGTATVKSVPLAKLSAYLPDEVGIAIADGTSDITFRYEVADSADGLQVAVNDVVWSLDGVRVVETAGQDEAASRQDLISFASLRFGGGEFGWPQRTLTFEEVSLTTPDVRLWRESDDRLVWEWLIRDRSTPDAIDLAGGPVVAADEQVVAAPPADQPEVAHEPPWNVKVERVLVNGGSARFEDRSLTPQTTLAVTGIDASVEALSLENDAEFPFKLDFDVEGGGSLALDGVLTAFPVVRFTGQTSVQRLSLPLVQPYIASATYLELESGKLDLAGTLTSSPEETLLYEGKLAVDDLSLVLAESRTRLVAWKRVSLDGVAVQLDAARAEIAGIELDEPYTRLHIAKDGTLNVDQVLRPDDAAEGKGDLPAPALAGARTEGAASAGAEAGSAETTGPWTMKVGRLRMVGGSTEYQDENLPLPFVIAVHKLNGEMSALDTASRTPARLSLEGEVGEYGLVRIKSAMQPLAPTRNTTFEAHFENIALPEASPYSILFAGHRIASGKLDLDTHYTIEGGHLEGQHDIVLRDFALGEKVEYPDAFDLPFGLVISLLKGPDGNIDVDLPVEGDVDDPQFRLGGVIVKALFGLLTNIVTSPFRLLGSLVGMGDSEDFDKVAFLPGHSDLAAPEREKVAKLASALVQRPQLTLQVPGIVDPVADAAAARSAQVKSRVEAAVAGGDQAVRRRVLEQMYTGTNPDEPIEGLVVRLTSIPAEGGEAVLDELAYLDEIERRLTEVEPVAPETLTNLATARSAAVRDAVLAGAEVEPARITATAIQEVKVNSDGVVMMTLGVDAG